MTAESNTWDYWTQIWSNFASSVGNPSDKSLKHHTADQMLPAVTVGDTSKLYWTQLSGLTHRVWLNSDILFEYQDLLSKEFLHIRFEHVVDADWLPSQRLSRFQNKQTIFCLHAPLHWFALKLDTLNKRILLCDSLPGIANPRKIFDQVQDTCKKIGFKYPLQEIVVNVPNQKNTEDCGVTTCLFMLCWAEDIEPDWKYDSKAFMRQFRLRIFADILNGKVTRLRQKA